MISPFDACLVFGTTGSAPPRPHTSLRVCGETWCRLDQFSPEMAKRGETWCAFLHSSRPIFIGKCFLALLGLLGPDRCPIAAPGPADPLETVIRRRRSNGASTHHFGRRAGRSHLDHHPTDARPGGSGGKFRVNSELEGSTTRADRDLIRTRRTDK